MTQAQLGFAFFILLATAVPLARCQVLKVVSIPFMPEVRRLNFQNSFFVCS